MYVGGSKILAIVYMGEIIWGHIEEAMPRRVHIQARYRNGIKGVKMIIDNKVYDASRAQRLVVNSDKFTFTLNIDYAVVRERFYTKKCSASKVNIRVNGQSVYDDKIDWQGKSEPYTVNLNRLSTNKIIISVSGIEWVDYN